MNKAIRLIKRLVALILVLLLSIESLAAVVSDNDGSAFITKAEFDSLKNNFQSQIDQYNTSIDSKIDGAIASYLSGIRLSSYIIKTPLCSNIFNRDIVFHGKNDNFGYPRMDSDGIHGYNLYNINNNRFMAIHQGATKRLGAKLLQINNSLRDNKFEFLIKGHWLGNKYYLISWAEDFTIVWNVTTVYHNYGTSNQEQTNLHYAWVRDVWYYDCVLNGSINVGTNTNHYYCWPERNSSIIHYSWDELNTSTKPTWASGASYSDSFSSAAGLLSEIDSGDYSDKIKHFWVDKNTSPAYGTMNLKLDLSSSDPVILQFNGWKQNWTTRTSNGNIIGYYYSDKSTLEAGGYNLMNDEASILYVDFYGPAICGRRGYESTNERYKQNSALNPSEVFYNGYDGEEYTLASSPLFDILGSKIDKLSFNITLKNESSLDDGWLYMTTKSYDTKVPTENILKIVKNDETLESDSIKLTKGIQYKITIPKELPEDTKIYFKIVPDSEAGRVVVDDISNYYLFQ